MRNDTINVIANGLPASPGAASGKVVFSSEEAERLTAIMQDTILVRVETSPEGHTRNACS
jgi:pyruvate,orthophosphate dikinase